MVSEITLFVAMKVRNYGFRNEFILNECNGPLNVNIWIAMLRYRIIFPAISCQCVSDTEPVKYKSISININELKYIVTRP